MADRPGEGPAQRLICTRSGVVPPRPYTDSGCLVLPLDVGGGWWLPADVGSGWWGTAGEFEIGRTQRFGGSVWLKTSCEIRQSILRSFPL